MLAQSNYVEIDSPPMVDYGYVTDDVVDRLKAVADSLVSHDAYQEPGRLSKRVKWRDDKAPDSPLHELARDLSTLYLNRVPELGSTAVISLVTDGDEFINFTQQTKAANNWHQDFVTTPRGFFFAPENTTRLVVPLYPSAAPICAIGNVAVKDPTQLAVIDETVEDLDRQAALATASVLIGADGVLVKSEFIPVGGLVHIAEPDRAYVIPPTSVHKAPEHMETGRIFFQLDAVNN